jgi:hypothetical protein
MVAAKMIKLSWYPEPVGVLNPADIEKR